MKLSQLRNKKILLVGYGVEGQATEKFLRARIPDINLTIADKKFTPHYLDNQSKYDIAIRSPGVPKSILSIPSTTATNIFFANVGQAITIGVTGSKGKSTTSSLIHHILASAGKKSHLAGNIGRPLLAELPDLIDKDEIFVCELSSYQLDDIAYSPHIAVVVTLFPEHMNYHGSVQAYYKAKRNIIRWSSAKDYFVFNSKVPQLFEWSKKARCLSIAIEDNPRLLLAPTKLIGEHNKLNILAAATVAKLLSISEIDIINALSSFQPLPHRLEYIGNYESINFYDDAISTTPESTMAAIRALPHVETLLLGGEDRGYDFLPLVEIIGKSGIKNIVLFPTSGKKIKLLLTDKGLLDRLQLFETSSMEEAIDFVFARTSPGKICLLSTASPSYSLWRNYEDKADQFRKAILAYAAKKTKNK